MQAASRSQGLATPANFTREFRLVKRSRIAHNPDMAKQKAARTTGGILPPGMSVSSQTNSGEGPEIAEQAKLVPELTKNDQSERSAWKLETDRAAFGRKKIPIPERWD